MRSIESIGMTRARGALRNPRRGARRALLNPDLTASSSGFLRRQPRLSGTTRDGVIGCAHGLTRPRRASLAGRLFVVDHATLLDDLDALLSAPCAGASFGRRSR